MEKYLEIICFDIHCIAMSVNLLEIKYCNVCSNLVNQKSQDMRFVTKLLCGLILEYTQLSKAPLVILRP